MAQSFGTGDGALGILKTKMQKMREELDASQARTNEIEEALRRETTARQRVCASLSHMFLHFLLKPAFLFIML